MLRSRNVDDCEVVVSWVSDADALYLFSGRGLRWPLDAAQLSKMESTAGYRAWMLVHRETDVPVGHLDFTIDMDVARIGRVLLDPARRGRGLAHVLTGLAVDMARSLGVSELRLNVISGNEPAVRAYARAGFTTLAQSERPGVQSMSLAL